MPSFSGVSVKSAPRPHPEINALQKQRDGFYVFAGSQHTFLSSRSAAVAMAERIIERWNREKKPFPYKSIRVIGIRGGKTDYDKEFRQVKNEFLGRVDAAESDLKKYFIKRMG